MINFTVGPVQEEQYICEIGADQVPYFRTPEFSEMMKENEDILLSLLEAPDNSRAVFLTGSGTAAMESTVMNVLNETDKVIVVNGGGFGARFSKLCDIHGIEHYDIVLNTGEALKETHLEDVCVNEYSAFLINVHETSSGVLYDMDLVGRYCKDNNLLLIADVISTFLADPVSMKDMGIDVAIASSQKAIACPPGVSMIALDDKAVRRVESNQTKCMYLDLKDALKNGERGQTPFTPAVGILRQINARLKAIANNGGAEYTINKAMEIANDFRQQISGLPFEVFSETQSNAVTALLVGDNKAKVIFETLKNEYGIWICPNGGTLGESLFRVGHIGNLTKADNRILVDAFYDLQKRGII